MFETSSFHGFLRDFTKRPFHSRHYLQRFQTTNDPASMVSQQEKRPFRFFDFPRELRDLVYCQLTRDVRVPLLRKVFHGNVKVQIANFPSLQLQLVSRRFRDEYTQETAHSKHQELKIAVPAHLVGGSTFSFMLQLLPQNVKHGLSSIKHMRLDLEAPYYYLHDRLTLTEHWRPARYAVDILLQLLPSLTRVTVRPHCGLAAYEEFIQKSGDPNELIECALRTWLLPESLKVEVQVILILTGQLWLSSRAESSPSWDVARQWQPDGHRDNRIVYEGRFSAKPYTWYGLDLSVASWDRHNTFDGVMKDIEAHFSKGGGDLGWS
ncbi:uncharacterized protein RCC_03571 [Ramularia collo-cygni]|uniref:F-box domain-containing protein n=1 Tax=Ramularia collo-cygni TaxID=112498 RepID=A0A2D3V5E4_9PEZI|nr:uncharacterized protein RCC_03571 [Ramularia collo-cygni]CZT17734.1 uncharacterized protein RCC_03571 [Ramularia collo-cygni]